MKIKAYYAEVVESDIASLKNDYTKLMRRYMKEDNEQKVAECSQAIIALGILEDRLFSYIPIEVEV